MSTHPLDDRPGLSLAPARSPLLPRLAISFFTFCFLGISSPVLSVEYASPSGEINSSLDRGSWHLTGFVGQYDSLDSDRDISLSELRLGGAYYFQDYLALVGEAHVGAFRGDRLDASGLSFDASTEGVGGDLLLRWHFLRRPVWSTYFDLGWGVQATDGDFPPGGTSVNGRSQVGLGFTRSLTPRGQLLVGARHLHISNGKGLVEDNPSYDSVGVYVGGMLRLGPDNVAEDVGSTCVPGTRAGDDERLAFMLELQAGQVDDFDTAGLRVELDTHLASHWRGHLEATVRDVEGESFSQIGVSAYRRTGRRLTAWTVDHQEFLDFTTDRVEVQGETAIGDRATAVGILGWEDRNLDADRLRGALRIRAFPLQNLLLEPGLAWVEDPDELEVESIDPTLNIEVQLPLGGSWATSIFFQDRVDELILLGIRLAPRSPETLRSRMQGRGFRRVRF